MALFCCNFLEWWVILLPFFDFVDLWVHLGSIIVVLWASCRLTTVSVLKYVSISLTICSALLTWLLFPLCWSSGWVGPDPYTFSLWLCQSLIFSSSKLSATSSNAASTRLMFEWPLLWKLEFTGSERLVVGALWRGRYALEKCVFCSTHHWNQCRRCFRFPCVAFIKLTIES